MKLKIISSLLILVGVLFSFTFTGDNNSNTQMINNIVVQFEGTNGNGNNLWLDNFSIGTRIGNDLAIYGFSIKDKNYLLPGVTSTNVTPVVTILNAGYNTSSATTVTMTDQASYNSTKSVSSISAGQTLQVTFDPITFNLNTTKNLKIYLNWAADQNKNNDTLTQPTTYHTGVNRRVLFEAHTSTTCGPCASQNPYLDAFIQERFDSVVAIKYHVWWPSPGDPMYDSNRAQQRIRTQYNSISAVPTLTVDGVHNQVSGYSTLSNLLTPYNNRRAIPSPISVSVTDTRLPGDTIKATINLQVVAPLSTYSNYKLKVAAIERKVTYATPPGSNGETIFYDVFRRMYPSVDGMSINYTPGTYTFEVKYKRAPYWVDSMMYTAVFIQDEYTHEVINCAKSRNYYADKIKLPMVKETDIIPITIPYQNSPLRVTGGIQVEMMENAVPPPEWTLINMDSNYTFWRYIYSAVNGPSFGGSKSVRINWYAYVENVGTVDILRSKVYNNVNLNDTIKFDWAYARRPGYDNDKLVVKVSTNGGSTFPFIIFNRQGSNLATAPDNSSSFVPTTGQWGTFAISLNAALTGIKPISSEIPSKFELYQNYPNPFNPTTTIKFAITKPSNVNVIVYDLTGRVIDILVNQKLEPGNYEYLLNAENYPSGIYFYRLNTEYFTDTRKMVLVK